MNLSVYLSIYLYVYIYIYISLSLSLSFYLSTYLSNWEPTTSPLHLSVYVSIYKQLRLHTTILHVTVCMYVKRDMYLNVAGPSNSHHKRTHYKKPAKPQFSGAKFCAHNCAFWCQFGAHDLVLNFVLMIALFSSNYKSRPMGLILLGVVARDGHITSQLHDFLLRFLVGMEWLPIWMLRQFIVGIRVACSMPSPFMPSRMMIIQS